MTITPKRKTNMPEFTDTFIKAGLDKGWLTPPLGGPGPSPLEALLSGVIWGMIFIGMAGLVAWMFVR